MQPQVLECYSGLYAPLSLPNIDVPPTYTLLHMVHLVRSQTLYHSKRVFFPAGPFNVLGILNNISYSQGFSIMYLPLRHSPCIRRS